VWLLCGRGGGQAASHSVDFSAARTLYVSVVQDPSRLPQDLTAEFHGLRKELLESQRALGESQKALADSQKALAESQESKFKAVAEAKVHKEAKEDADYMCLQVEVDKTKLEVDKKGLLIRIARLEARLAE